MKLIKYSNLLELFYSRIDSWSIPSSTPQPPSTLANHLLTTAPIATVRELEIHLTLTPLLFILKIITTIWWWLLILWNLCSFEQLLILTRAVVRLVSITSLFLILVRFGSKSTTVPSLGLVLKSTSRHIFLTWLQKMRMMSLFFKFWRTNENQK